MIYYICYIIYLSIKDKNKIRKRNEHQFLLLKRMIFLPYT